VSLLEGCFKSQVSGRLAYGIEGDALIQMGDLSSALNAAPASGFSFGEFRLEADGTLLRKGDVVPLSARELVALRILLENAGRVVSPALLRKALRDAALISGEGIAKCISSLCARLQPEHHIESVYKRGYRFSPGIQRLAAAGMRAQARLAILPFSTGFGVQEYLGPALAEDTIRRIEAMPHPPVALVARDSVFALAENIQSAMEIGEVLDADLVLTGSLYAMPEHIRLRVEMVQVKDRAQIWVEDLLGPRNNVGCLDVDLVHRLMTRFGSEGLMISAAAASEADEKGVGVQSEAYQSYLRGHHEWQTLQRHCMQDGLQHLYRALEIDPAFTAARVDIVNACVAQALYGFMSPVSAAENTWRIVESTPEAVKSAVEILPAIGWIQFHVKRNLPAAIQAFSQSAHLPHQIWITQLRLMFALSRRHFAEALGLLQSALREDPYSPWLHGRLAWTLHLAGETTESVSQICRTIDRFPAHEGSMFYGALILAYNGKPEQATRLAQGLSQKLAYFDLGTAVYAYALACQGRNDEARAILERLQWLSRERFVLSSFVPAAYVALGEHEAALAVLRTSAEVRCPWFFQMLADPRLKPLHERKEFAQLESILAGMEEQSAHGLGIQPGFAHVD